MTHDNKDSMVRVYVQRVCRFLGIQHPVLPPGHTDCTDSGVRMVLRRFAAAIDTALVCILIPVGILAVLGFVMLLLLRELCDLFWCSVFKK